MEKFQSIEDKLNQFAEEHKTEVRKDSMLLYGIIPVDIQGRNIFWSDGAMSKGILIQPHLTHMGRITGLWNFEITAWVKYRKSSDNAPFWQKHLLKAVKFREIEKAIDDLLYKSVAMLNSIKKKDMKVYDDSDDFDDISQDHCQM